MIFIGIDPGINGGIAILSGDIVYAESMPDRKGLWSLLHRDTFSQNTYAVIEQVQGYVGKDKGLSGMGRSMFSFGMQYGTCLMALEASGIPFEIISSRRWQKPFSENKIKGESYLERKRRLKEVAQGLFPDTKVTLKTADALLLATYARRIHDD